MRHRLLAVAVERETDIVLVRQRTRKIAEQLGFERQDQTRITTAVSEIVRNALDYGGGGRAEFWLDNGSPQCFEIVVQDNGPGIADVEAVLDGSYRSTTGMGVGVAGARRLMDDFTIQTAPGKGVAVRMVKCLPPRTKPVSKADLQRIAQALAGDERLDPNEELRLQNRDMLLQLQELQRRQGEMTQLNQELQDTNRGVVALYAELEERADHLRRADELKSRFLSNMSHEFRTPLNSILALSRLLLTRKDGELTGEQEKQVQFVRRAAENLTELVNDLLDIAKVEAGKTVVTPAEFSIADLFGALRGMLRPLLVGDNLTLTFEEAVDLPPLVTDEGKVSQILRNFISNAIKFTERGEVRVSAHLTDNGRKVVIAVADTGIGIAQQDQSLIFEEFTQVANRLQGRVKGTGLGLPLCRRLARLMQGEVSMDSELGIGSTFRTTLPVHFDERNGAIAAPAPVRVEIDPAMVPVLIIEDEPETQFIHEKLLQGSRYQAVSARNLREAREVLTRVKPRAVLLDILLRGEDSWRWLADLKQNPVMADVPVIIATNMEDERKARALGADGYCQKPLSRASLIAELDTLVGRDVLVIDDDPAARYLMQKMLTDHRTRVLEAVDGRSGLEKARATRPSMIFLDLQLPDSSGEDVLGALRRDSQLRETPVAIVTSRTLSSEERDRLGVRAQAVLQKNELNASTAREILSRHGL